MRRVRWAVLGLWVLAGCATPLAGKKKEPMSPPIVQSGAEVLRRPAAPVSVEDIRTPQFQALLQQMVAAMRQAPGVGLAAPQLGVSLRVFVVEDRPELMATLTPAERAERERVPVPVRVFINPLVKPVGQQQATFFEGCLSVAGYSALVPRYLEVEVQGLDENAQPVRWQVRGWPARILQHEYDHLEGGLYVDRMHSRSFGTAAQLKERFAGMPIGQVLQAFGL